MHPFLPFLTLLISWSVDFTDPDIQEIISYLFIAIHVVIAAIVVYLFFRIWEANDMRMLRVKDQYTNEMQDTTVAGYDFSKWRELLFTKFALPMAVGLFISSRWSTPFPLLLQCINNPNTLYTSPLFQLHVWGRAEEAKLVRPWKDESVMPEWARQLWQQRQAEEESPNTSAHGGSAGKAKRRKSA